MMANTNALRITSATTPPIGTATDFAVRADHDRPGMAWLCMALHGIAHCRISRDGLQRKAHSDEGARTCSGKPDPACSRAKALRSEGMRQGHAQPYQSKKRYIASNSSN